MAAKQVGKQISVVEVEQHRIHQGSEAIVQKAGVPPRTSYRLVHPIVLQRDTHADSIVIVKEALRLSAEFFALVYDALSSVGQTPEAKVTKHGNFAIVALDAPRLIQSMKIADSVIKAGADSVEIYRVDGHKPTKDPVTTAEISPSKLAYVPSGAGFVAAEFAVVAKNGGDQIALDGSSLLTVEVISYPSAPRVGLAVKGKEGQAAFFKNLPGERGKDSKLPGDLSANKEFADALDRLVASWASPLPTLFEISLVIESDAPCTVTLTEFVTKYHQMAEGFLIGGKRTTDKQTLRFAAGKTTSQTIDLGLPAGAKVVTASLKTAQNLGKDKLSSGGGPALALDQKQGLCLNADRGAAQPFKSDEPKSLTGAALGLVALEDKTQLSLELREDFNGEPNGKKLAEGAATIGTAGARDWIVFQFKQAASIPAGSFWLVLTAGKGSAVWLAGAGDPAARTMERDDPKEPLKVSGPLPGLQALYQPITRDAPSQAQSPAGSLQASLSGTSLAPVAAEGSVTYDLKPALAAHPGSGSTVLFTSALPGFITVYPPKIEYDTA